MQKLLKLLEKQNNFKLHNIYVAGSMNQDNIVFDTLDSNPTNLPAIILKHHTFINFTNYNRAAPTFLNVVRNPVDRFASEYYFCRHGWHKKPDYKGNACKNMTESELSQSIDDCVLSRKKECIQPDFGYFEWLCGNDQVCKNLADPNKNIYESKSHALSYVKNNVLNGYFVIGLLEEFETTLKLFEQTMPVIFRGVSGLFSSDRKVQEIVSDTKTINRGNVGLIARAALENEVFRYEMDLFRFIQAKFHKQVQALL